MEVYKSNTTRTHGYETQTQIRRKLGGEINSDKIVFKGRPLSAQLCAIYFDAMMQEYDDALHGEIKQAKQETYGGNEFGEHKVATHLWRYSNTNKKKHRPQPPRLYAKPESF